MRGEADLIQLWVWRYAHKTRTLRIMKFKFQSGKKQRFNVALIELQARGRGIDAAFRTRVGRIAGHEARAARGEVARKDLAGAIHFAGVRGVK